MSFGDWRTCRVCGVDGTRLFKYSTRHYVHADCAMTKWGADFFARLTPHQASRFPVLVAARAGHMAALEARASEVVKATGVV